jgi:undecaprenyl-diphosphatase
MAQFDLYIADFIQSFRAPFLNEVMIFITYLGKWYVVVGLASLVALSFVLKKRWHYLTALIVSVAGGEIIVAVLKNLIERPRPPIINALLYSDGFSFPSGHSFVALSFYGLLAYFRFRSAKTKSQKIFFIAAGFFLISLIGFSRVYLGNHWPSDVLGSFVLGAIWLAAIIASLEIKKRNSSYSSQNINPAA